MRQSISPSCPLALMTPGFAHMPPPKKRSRWRTRLGPASSSPCIIKHFVSALNPSGNRLSVSRRGYNMLRTGSPCARSARRLFYQAEIVGLSCLSLLNDRPDLPPDEERDLTEDCRA